MTEAPGRPSAGRPADSSSGPFDLALLGGRCLLELGDGRRLELPAARWHDRPDEFDRAVLARCLGSTLDIGCGPGRLTAALHRRGVPVLGIDVSPIAVALARRRGAPAVLANVFEAVPGAGFWQQVLLMDGNIGLGGDPRALLHRVAGLLAADGRALVEVGPPGTGLHRELIRSAAPGPPAAWYPWARVAVDAIGAPARAGGLTVRHTGSVTGRWYAELAPIGPRHRSGGPPTGAGPAPGGPPGDPCAR